MTYPDVDLFIDGQWRPSESGVRLDIANPANGELLGTVAHSSEADLDAALQAAQTGFLIWSGLSAFERSKIMRRAADLLRERADPIARLITREQGKPFAEAKMEALGSADIIDWFAEEGRRTYGRVIPARGAGIRQLVLKEPIGPVAAFTPWNFPVSQIARKVGAGLAGGCSFIVKGPEETPASAAELIRCLADAGLPAGVLNLVFGSPAQISQYLIPHPIIRKVSFTGSVPVGKHLAALAGQHMKRVTMELGGHSPVVVFDDADLEVATKALVAYKFRNAGQVCISPTRFLIQSNAYNEFVERFVDGLKAIKIGNGMEPDTNMGPLATSRRVEAIESLVADAVAKGATAAAGGMRSGNQGCFFEPTVLTNVNASMRAMNEEPFGPVALMKPFEDFDEAIAEANRLPYGLAAYAWTGSTSTATLVANNIESGMVSINHLGLGLPETPLGGVKDSGYGSEGGLEAVEAYLNGKFVTQASL